MGFFLLGLWAMLALKQSIIEGVGIYAHLINFLIRMAKIENYLVRGVLGLSLMG